MKLIKIGRYVIDFDKVNSFRLDYESIEVIYESSQIEYIRGEEAAALILWLEHGSMDILSWYKKIITGKTGKTTLDDRSSTDDGADQITPTNTGFVTDEEDLPY